MEIRPIPDPISNTDAFLEIMFLEIKSFKNISPIRRKSPLPVKMSLRGGDNVSPDENRLCRMSPGK
jgi:hypothetical protein